MSFQPLSDNEFLFTSESVTEGHPDKMADQISDGVLDAVLRDDPYGRVACETLVNTGLVVSTSLAGIATARKAEGLSGTDGFDAVLGDRPDSLSALVFLDLNQLLTLGEQAGLAEDPRYLALRDDLQKLRAAGAVLTREGEFTTAELTFQIP